MLYSLICVAALAACVAMLIDLKIDHWEWTNLQRKVFAVIGALVAIWAVKRSPSIWLHFLIAGLMLAGMLLVYRQWKKHRKQGGNFTFPQLAAGLGICFVAGWTFFDMVAQLLPLIIRSGGL